MVRFRIYSPPRSSGRREPPAPRFRSFAAFVCSLTFLFWMADDAQGSVRMRSDAPLLAALRADATVRNCKCLEAAVWINQSYPRITVDGLAWKRLNSRERRRFCERSLGVAEATYLTEFAATDQYRVLYLYDRRGVLLVTYMPP